jgi:hypothetical protein
VTTIVGLIILGILLPMGARAGSRLLGTTLSNGQLELVPCPTTPDPNITCVGTPGFGCTSQLYLDNRLARRNRVYPISGCRRVGQIPRVLGLLLPSYLLIPWRGTHWNCGRRNRTTTRESSKSSSSSILSHRLLLRRRSICSRVERLCKRSYPQSRFGHREFFESICVDGTTGWNSWIGTRNQCRRLDIFIVCCKCKFIPQRRHTFSPLMAESNITWPRERRTSSCYFQPIGFEGCSAIQRGNFCSSGSFGVHVCHCRRE